MKEKLKNVQRVDDGYSFNQSQEFLSEMPVAKLMRVLETWMKQLKDASRGMEATYYHA
jgi:hypothetical protein